MLGFGPDDLMANRRGTLGPKQIAGLRRRASIVVAQIIGVAAALLIVAFAVADRPLKVIQWVLLSAVAAGALIASALQWRRFHAAIARAAVECHTGALQVRLHGKAGQYLHVDDESFRLYRRFDGDSGTVCSVYVVPGIRRVVAVEPVDD